LQLPPFNNSYERHVRADYFKEAVVITNDTNLVCPEDIAVSSNGTIYTGLTDGSIVSVTPESN
jgi:hypothetical protein